MIQMFLKHLSVDIHFSGIYAALLTELLYMFSKFGPC